MADTIGPVDVDNRLYAMVYSSRQTVIRGRATSRILYNQIHELCRKALNNSAIIVPIGLHGVGVDFTPEKVLTVYCIFDSDKLLNGWYVIAGLNYPASQFLLDMPYAITLYFEGTDRLLQRGYDLLGLEDEDNDWEV